MNESTDGNIEQRICALYDQGESAPTISALTGIPSYRVRSILKGHGYTLQGGSRSGKVTEWPQIEAILSEVTSFKEISERTGIPYMTVVRWCREEGVEPENLRESSAAKEKVSKLSDDGWKAEDIAREVNVSTATVHRWLKKEGKGTHPVIERRRHKREKYWSQVLGLHRGGQTVYEIAEAIGDVNWGTVSAWLREEGERPLYGATGASGTKKEHPRQEEALRRYLEGETASAIEATLRISKGSVRAWAVAEGVWEQGGKFKKSAAKRTKAISLYNQGLPLDAIIKQAGIDYYALRIALHEEGLMPYPEEERPATKCPCGQRTGSPSLRYCSPECRAQYGQRRKPDPANLIEAVCCNDKCSLPEGKFSYSRSQGHRRYCSNACSQQHQRTAVQTMEGHRLDSSLEAAFYGLCALLGMDARRFDGAQIPFGPNGSYGPDFLVFRHGKELAVELKGEFWIKGDTKAKWASWREKKGALVVLREEDLLALRLCADADKLWSAMKIKSIEQSNDL